ncbi:PHD finger protein ALFIN-LIKE 3-like [Momordica charantia]|uniref:PHD finger protein ALFIN-LIKE n=1 Tax=Momordica charantia TaxID=3673 RepID=A0A6J1D1F2_MOMCH|nr:PHD finger protein ALFIN-LIKE 3-like [Momordica charantia]
MEEGASTVKKVFQDFLGRRTSIVKALTLDVEEFVRQCDLEEEDEVCLYGLPDGEWRVRSASTKAATNPRPEPASGINFARDDRTQLKDWLFLVAALSDAWLLSLAFYNGACYFDRVQRQCLFGMINDIPTILETITRRYKSRKPPKTMARAMETKEEDNEICGSCDKKPNPNQKEFWICCDFCDTWFHGQCVKITPDQSTQIHNYKCPSCSYKCRCRRLRQQSIISIKKASFKLKCKRSQ